MLNEEEIWQLYSFYQMDFKLFEYEVDPKYLIKYSPEKWKEIVFYFALLSSVRRDCLVVTLHFINILQTPVGSQEGQSILSTVSANQFCQRNLENTKHEPQSGLRKSDMGWR